MSNFYLLELDTRQDFSKRNKIIKTVNDLGFLNGLYEEYDDKGRLIVKCIYKDSVLNGSHMIRVFNSSDVLIQVTKQTFVNGVLTGAFQDNHYNSSLQLVSYVHSNYVDNLIHGQYTTLSNGVITSKTYINGVEATFGEQ